MSWREFGFRKKSEHESNGVTLEAELKREYEQSRMKDRTMRLLARLLTFHRAALVAVVSLEQRLSLCKHVPEAVKLHLYVMHLQSASLQTETNFLDAIVHSHQQHQLYKAMDPPKLRLLQQQVLFKLMDRDGDDTIGLYDLAHAFCQMDPTQAFCTNVWNAQQSIDKFGTQGKTLSFDDFLLFLDDLQEAMHCNFDDLCALLVLWLSFNYTGHDVLQEAMGAVERDRKEGHLTEFEDEIVEIRMALLFQMLDYNGTGRIFFCDLLERLYMMDTTSTSTTALLYCHDNDARLLDYHQFTTILLHVAAAGCVRFHEMADSITLASIDKNNDKGKEFVQRFAVEHAMTERIKRLLMLWNNGDDDDDDDKSVSVLQRALGRLRGTSHEWDEAIRVVETMEGRLDEGTFAGALSKMELPPEQIMDYLVVEHVLPDENRDAYCKELQRQMRRGQQQATPRNNQSWFGRVRKKLALS